MLDNTQSVKQSLSEKSVTLKRLASWMHLSDIEKSTITHADWYHPRDELSASKLRDVKHEHYIYGGDNPFSQQTMIEAERYLIQHNTRAFLIWHKGKLVHSNYINFHPDGVFNSMSLVKSLIGICIGIAIDNCMILDKDEPAWHYLPEWQNDARKYISIDHLLTMQSGLQSDVSINIKSFLPIIDLQFGDDIRKTALAIPAVAPPEHKFVYNNYNSQLLGIILERASGMTFAQFVDKYIWQPLGCGDAFAWTDKHGASRTFAGFFARPIDWIKLGNIVLNQGSYVQDSASTQIVSPEWIKLMLTPTNTSHRGVKDAHADYGRHIWLESHHYGVIAGIPRIEGMYANSKHADTSMVFFEGMRGQYVFISPKHDLVVMRMGEKPKRDWDGSKVINMLVNEL